MNGLPILIGKYLIGFIGIGMVVVVHELGHLLVARLCGIEVEVFSFGMGPRVWGKTFRSTEFRLSAFPFGGYCRMKGTDDLTRALDKQVRTFEHTEVGSLFSIGPFRRILTYLAGPVANITLAILLYALLAASPYKTLSRPAVIVTVDSYPTLFSNATSPAHTAGLRNGDRVLALDGREIRDWEDLENTLQDSDGRIRTFTVLRDELQYDIPVLPDNTEDGSRFGITNSQLPLVGSVRPHTPEQEAGLKVGDLIVACNGYVVANSLDLLQAMQDGQGATVMTVLRNGTHHDLSFIPNKDEQGNGVWSFALRAESRTVTPPPFSFATGAKTTWRILRETIHSLILLFTGRSDDVRQEFTGMARAALMIGDITSLGLESDMDSGFRALLYLLGIVSISLAIGNMLPLPAFDGGQILIGFYEAVSRRRIAPRTYWILQLVGMGAVICIFAFMSYVDLRHWYLIKH